MSEKMPELVIKDYWDSLPFLDRQALKRYLSTRLQLTDGVVYNKIKGDIWTVAERFFVINLIKDFEDARKNGILLIA